MKSIFTILITFTAALAFAADKQETKKVAAVSTSQAAVDTVDAATPGTSAVQREEVIPEEKGDINIVFDLWNEKAQSSIDAGDSALGTEQTVKVTKKLDENRSLRLLTGMSNQLNASGDDVETDMMDTYLQYAHSNITKVEGKDLTLLQRVYLPTSEGSRDDGLIIPQARTYLFTSFAINEKWKIIPYLNPRFYIGDSDYRQTTNDFARMYWVLESAYSFSDNLSWTFDFIHRNKWGHNSTQAQDNIIDTWLTLGVTDKFSFDLGMYNLTEDENPRFTVNRNNYYLNLTIAVQ